jgi:hypothetical protein
MSSTPPRLIWYRLVDADTGQPYKGTTADKVRLGNDSDVADFRKAVHVENSAILTENTSSQLLVYENQDSFDKRNAVDGTKEEPLEEDSLINELGKSKKEALIVVVPTQLLLTSSSLQESNSAKDISEQLYHQLTQPFDTEPSIDQLKDALRSKPLVQIPIDSSLCHILTVPSPYFNFSEFFRFSADETFNLSQLLVEIARMPFDSDYNGEASLHYYVDLFMKRILKGLLHYDTLAIHVARNISDSSFTTDHGLRPDFLFYVDAFLILRGEEKKIMSELAAAKTELSGKLKSWNPVIFGALNYVFGFACAGEYFQLYAIGPRGVITNISQIFDLQKVQSRFELFFSIINLARVIKTIHGRIPYTSVMMYQPMKRGANGATVEITDDMVIKRIPVSQHSKKASAYDFLKKLYQSMDKNSVPYVCRCNNITTITKTGKNRPHQQFLQLMLVPHGCQIKPHNLEILLNALGCVLRALEGVHNLRYAHCDVRWPNILRVSDDYWMLIDFENADDISEELLKKDINMVGKLINDCNIFLTMAVSDFRNTLVSNTPPSVADALRILDDL